MSGLLSLSDAEFAAWLRSLPREKSAEQVEREVRFTDITIGEYLPHGAIVHHSAHESRH